MKPYRRRGVLQALHDAAARRGDDGIAMLTAIMMMMVITMLMLSVLAALLGQLRPTQQLRRYTQSLNAAQAGIEATLSRIRSATSAPDINGNIYGNPGALPCSMSGTVAGPSDGLGYQVTVQYFRDDPTNQAASWITANQLACTDPYGTRIQPLYALITSAGSSPSASYLQAGVGERTISTLYHFQTTNIDVAGGRVFSFANSACLRANSAAVNAQITYVDATTACATDDDLELWVYDTTYQLKLASTMPPAPGPVLCITGPSSNTSALTTATLQQCKDTTDSARWNQLWSWTGSKSWQGENTAISDYGSFCLRSTASNLANSPVNQTLATSSCVSEQDGSAFNPMAAVGPGAASHATNQVVSYLEFGRCLDVTGEVIDVDHEIVYPCKQDPSGGTKLAWNHKWFYSEPTAPATSTTTTVTVVVPVGYYAHGSLKDANGVLWSGTWCLTAPAQGGNYPTYQRCVANANNQKWTRFAKDSSYGASYTFQDYLTRCLALGPTTDKDGNWTKVYVSSCDGAVDQKWNADRMTSMAGVGNYKESTGG